MPHSVNSFSYYGSRVEHAVDHLNAGVNNVFDRINNILHSFGRNLLSATYGLRQEVPFERWFYDHGFATPVETPLAHAQARVWALFSALESGLRLKAEAISYLFSFAFAPQNSSRHAEIVTAQMQSLSLSLLAILSPNAAKERANNGGVPLIGASLGSWRWGTLYTGKLEIPLWKLESSNYPWAPN